MYNENNELIALIQYDWGEVDIIWTIIFIFIVTYYIYISFLIWTNKIIYY
jgi:hypothetical protein